LLEPKILIYLESINLAIGNFLMAFFNVDLTIMKQRPFFFLILLLCFFSCKNSDSVIFEIKGKVENLEGVHVSLLQDQNGSVISKTVIKNNEFTIRARLNDNQFCELLFESDPYIENGRQTGWLHPVKIFVEKGATYLIKARDRNEILYNNYDLETTSSVQQQFQMYNAQIKNDFVSQKAHLVKLEHERTRLLAENKDIDYEAYTDSVRYNERELTMIPIKVARQYISRAPNTYISLYLLSKAPDIASNSAFYNLIAEQLRAEYRSHPYAVQFIKHLQAVSRLKSHRKMPRFEVLNTEGKRINFDELSDKKLTIIDFWATWCAPCMEELPSVLKLSSELARQHVNIVFVSFDNNRAYWSKMSEHMKIPNSCLVDEKNKQNLMDELNIFTIPRYLLINSKGEIIDYDAPRPGTNEFDRLIKSAGEF